MLTAIEEDKTGVAVPAGLVPPRAPTVIHLATSQCTRVHFQGLGDLLNKHRCVFKDADMAKYTDPRPEEASSRLRTGQVSNLVPLLWYHQPGPRTAAH